MGRKILIVMGMLILTRGINSWAEEERRPAAKYNLGEVIVTATKTEQYQAEVGSSTTVITAEEIEKRGKMTAVELLRTVPGVSIIQNGGLGSFAQLYLRGGAPGYTMVMIDGVEIKYLMEHDGGFFDFAHLTTDNIERIEIIRGPQSTLINIITKKGEGPPKFSISFEGGSHNTLRELLGLSGSTEKINYSFSVSRVDSEGISSAAEGAEKDGCEITTASSRLGFNILEDSELSLVLRYSDADIDIDDGAYEDDPNYTARKKMFSSKIQFDQPLTDWWEHKLFFSFLDTERNYRDPSDSIDTTEDKDSWYKGDVKKFDWQHNFSPFDFDTITCGFDYKEERGSSYYCSGGWISKAERENVDNKGYYFQNQLKLWEKFFTTVGLRIDDHELFGTETTYKLSSAYLIPQTGTRFKANWGTGFRAPSIYQLYSSYGDPNLNPEKSESYDFGVEQNLLDNKLSLGLTYFHNDFKNLINYSFATSKYENIGKAETKGIEAEVTFKAIEDLTIGANYTYLDTEDKETGLELLRRPESQAGLNLNWQFLEKANLNLGITYVGKRSDYTPYPTRGTNKDYTKVDISTSYDLTENFQIFGRIENLFDEEYQEVYGFTRPGQSFSAGIKATF
jgi:vitamin B12 transporter